MFFMCSTSKTIFKKLNLITKYKTISITLLYYRKCDYSNSKLITEWHASKKKIIFYLSPEIKDSISIFYLYKGPSVNICYQWQYHS